MRYSILFFVFIIKKIIIHYICNIGIVKYHNDTKLFLYNQLKKRSLPLVNQ